MQIVHLEDLQANLREVEEEIHEDFAQFEGPIELLDSIPGIDLMAAHAILADWKRYVSFPYCTTYLLLGRVSAW